MESPAQWNKRLATYCKPETKLSVMQLAVTLAVFLSLIGLAHFAYSMRWFLSLPFSIAAGGMIIKLFTIQHDCGHRSFFKKAQVCDIVGQCLSVFTLTPYDFWRRDHDKHHATSGHLDRRGHGDVSTLTVAEYRSLPFMKRLAYRTYRHPALLFGLGPTWQFVLRYRIPLTKQDKHRKRTAVSIISHDIALVLFFGTLSLCLGWRSVLMVWFPAVLVAATIGVWLFFIQHQHEDTYWERDPSWSFVEAAIQGCSYYRLPRWLHWVTGNIGYHHIHHLSSRIPNYKLARVFAEIPELQAAPALGFWESLKCARLSLWCERRRRLVSFRDAAAASWM